MAGMYTDDAILLVPRQNFLRGQTAIARFWHQVFDTARPLDPSLSRIGIIKLEEMGDAVLEIGWCLFKYQPADSPEPQTGYAKFMVSWKQEGGQWKIAAHTFNNKLLVPCKAGEGAGVIPPWLPWPLLVTAITWQSKEWPTGKQEDSGLLFIFAGKTSHKPLNPLTGV